MNNVVYISDFFVEHIRGGGELNDYELINILKSRNPNYDLNKTVPYYNYGKNNTL